MLIIPTFIGVVSMVGIFSYLAGYEKRTKEEEQENAFWKEVDKRGL